MSCILLFMSFICVNSCVYREFPVLYDYAVWNLSHVVEYLMDIHVFYVLCLSFVLKFLSIMNFQCLSSFYLTNWSIWSSIFCVDFF